MAEAWRQDPVLTRYEAIEGRNHFTVIDPLGHANSAMTKRVVELARKVQAEQF
jgi:arylformamidase